MKTLYRRPNQLSRPVSFTSQHVKLHSKDPDDTEDESDTNEAEVRYIPISPYRYSDAPVAQVDSVDLSDILLRLEKLCKEEMAKVEWEPEHSCSPFTCTASTENIMIYLNDSASESFKGVEPIFMQTSGLGVNTAMLDEYRAGRGPRPREDLDFLASLRKGRSQSAKYSKQATGSSITAGCDLRPTIPSYAEVLKELEDWNMLVGGWCVGIHRSFLRSRDNIACLYPLHQYP